MVKWRCLGSNSGVSCLQPSANSVRSCPWARLRVVDDALPELNRARPRSRISSRRERDFSAEVYDLPAE
jgi:hypothetical protein